MKILVTGANGFVGKALCKHLAKKQSFALLAAVRSSSILESESTFRRVNLDEGTLDEALVGIDCVIHLAARVHRMNDAASDLLDAYREINTSFTLRLAEAALNAGVKRFVFLSSVKVNGEVTPFGQPFTVFDSPNPQDPYSISKAEAEDGLRRLSRPKVFDVVIIRPTLIYGPGVKANFKAMMDRLRAGIPLPFGSINNLRSLTALDNLCGLIECCIEHPNAADQTFLVSDDEDLSTTELLFRTGKALGHPARLIRVPQRFIVLGARCIGQYKAAHRLLDSLQVDVTHTKQQLGWVPPIGVDDALQRTAEYYLRSI